jgi:hypothetical protein
MVGHGRSTFACIPSSDVCRGDPCLSMWGGSPLRGLAFAAAEPVTCLPARVPYWAPLGGRFPATCVHGRYAARAHWLAPCPPVERAGVQRVRLRCHPMAPQRLTRCDPEPSPSTSRTSPGLRRRAPDPLYLVLSLPSLLLYFSTSLAEVRQWKASTSQFQGTKRG